MQPEAFPNPIDSTDPERILMAGGSGRDSQLLFSMLRFRTLVKSNIYVERLQTEDPEEYQRLLDLSQDALIGELRGRLHSDRKTAALEDWLKQNSEKIKATGVKIPASTETVAPSIPESALIDGRIASAQQEQINIERNLTEALSKFPQLSIDIGRNQYGWPEYHISLKDGTKIGIIGFASVFNKDEEVSVIEFRQTITNDEKKNRVLMTLSDMSKDKIEKSVKAFMVGLDVDVKSSFSQSN